MLNHNKHSETHSADTQQNAAGFGLHAFHLENI